MMKNMRGHAAILFALFIPGLFGVFILGTDGANMLQSKARLNEALEVASLAVAAQDSDQDEIRKATARIYIQHYFPNSTVDSSSLTVTKTICEYGGSSCNIAESETRYYKYDVSASITSDLWIAGTSEEDTFDASASSRAKKYAAKSVDVVLVSDFSASMYEYWNGERKFRSLINVVKSIATELQKYNDRLPTGQNKNTIGLVGFDYYTKPPAASNRFSANIYCDKYKKLTRNGNYIYAGGWESNSGQCASLYPTHPEYNRINVGKTIDKVFQSNDIIHNSAWQAYEVTNISSYKTLALTSNISNFTDQLGTSNFNITNYNGSGTASFTGVIRGAQVLDGGANNRRLMVILSDGGDSYVSNANNFSDALYDGGLCTSIKSHFEENNIGITLAVIGFNYNMKEYPQISTCVGNDNVYSATDMDQVKQRILSLITEEIGHLAN